MEKTIFSIVKFLAVCPGSAAAAQLNHNLPTPAMSRIDDLAALRGGKAQKIRRTAACFALVQFDFAPGQFAARIRPATTGRQPRIAENRLMRKSHAAENC
ncbi:MAG TPA: hypothetical protein VK438_00600 [Xanthobacteraceae bacterium]|nr:hypothetical protein [Xanthobacteraceae bacterium]